MTDYLREIKKGFRDLYGFKPNNSIPEEPTFHEIPDGDYPMKINGKIDNVKVVDGKIHCCKFSD